MLVTTKPSVPVSLSTFTGADPCKPRPAAATRPAGGGGPSAAGQLVVEVRDDRLDLLGAQLVLPGGHAPPALADDLDLLLDREPVADPLESGADAALARGAVAGGAVATVDGGAVGPVAAV